MFALWIVVALLVGSSVETYEYLLTKLYTKHCDGEKKLLLIV